MTLSGSVTDVIIPVFNEEEILEEFYRRVRELDLQLNLIFIDNASSDRSCEIIESFPNVTLIRHKTNEGYGGSLIDGMNRSTNDNIIIIDADCEYPPEAIPQLLAALKEHEVVYTSRFLGGADLNADHIPVLKVLGNKIITGLFNLFFRQQTTDLYTGCKALRRNTIKGLEFRRKGFEHVLEFACTLSMNGHTIVDIPVRFSPRNTGVSKMRHLSETLKFIMLLVYFRFFKSAAISPSRSQNG